MRTSRPVYCDDDAVCPECGKSCGIKTTRDEIAYSGTHCTYGRPGVHCGPWYAVSDCCEAEIEDAREEEM